MRLSRLFAVSCAVLSLTPPSAWSQEPEAQRPFQRVFRGDPSPVGNQRLFLDLTASETYDDNVLSGRLSSADPRVGDSGYYPSASANLMYERLRGRTSLTLTGSSGLSYYPSLDGRTDHNHGANAAINLPLGRRTTARFSQSVAYATYYTLAGVPGSVQPVAPVSPTVLPPVAVVGSQIASESGTEYHSFASIERQIGRRGTLNGHYTWGAIRFPSRDTNVQEAGVNYQREMGRRLSLRAGYGIQTGTSISEDDDIVIHNIDAGVDYNRTLPGLRNTTMSVSTGSTVIQLERGHQFGLSVSAGLVHLMGRSWMASISYDRGAEFLPVVGDVLQSDSVVGSIGGMASQRVELTFTGSYSSGHLGLREEAETKAYNGGAELEFGLSSRFAINTSYRYYFYDFADAATLPVGLPFAESRHSVTAGLVVHLPLIR
jgi:hypothetical protein